MDFSAKDEEWDRLFRVHTIYRKIVVEWKYIDVDFYSNDSLNDYLKSELKKD